MKKKDLLKNLALMGLAGGLVVGCKPQNGDTKNSNGKGNSHGNGKNGNGNGSHMSSTQSRMSADQESFYDKLNARGKAMYRDMDDEARDKSMKVADAGCKGKNMCKGMGGCATGEHQCAGQNACKGKGGGPVSPSKAVMLVNEQMKAKRNGM